MLSRTNKDLRCLFPEFAFALLIVGVPCQVLRAWGWQLGEIAPVQLFLLALAVSSVSSAVFGKDLSLGMLSFSLAQIDSRAQLWKEKLLTGSTLISLLLLLALGSLLPLTSNDWSLRILSDQSLESPLVLIGLGVIVTLASLAGGIFFSLLLRSYIGAFWLALLTPLTLCSLVLVLDLMTSTSLEASLYGTVSSALNLGYSVCLLFMAKKKFLNWEDLGSHGAEIWLTKERDSSNATNGRTRQYRPIIALCQKELSLQQLNFVVAACLMLLYVVCVLFYDVQTSRPSEAGLLAYFSRAVLLVFLPLAIGATSMAEERRLGVEQWLISLPVSGRMQWLLKVGTTYATLVGIAMLCPLLLDLQFEAFWDQTAISQKVRVILAIVIPFLFTTLGLYASSLSPNFLTALGVSTLTLLGITAIWFLGLSQLEMHASPENTAVPEFLFATVLVTLTLPAFWILNYVNYRTTHATKTRLWGNLLTWIGLAILTVSISQFIYARAWEKLTYRPIAPRPPIENIDVEARILPHTLATVLAPNGTLWTSDLPPDPTQTNALMTQIGKDSDWVRAVATFQNLYAIKRDGRLFTARKEGPEAYQLKLVPNPNTPATWKEILDSPRERSPVGLQSDGTLWRWSEAENGEITDPVRYLPDHVWESVARNGNGFIGIHPNGTMWAWGNFPASHHILGENPLEVQLRQEIHLLFSTPDYVGPPDPELQGALASQEYLLTTLKRLPLLIQTSSPKQSLLEALYFMTRSKALKINETPYQVGSRNDWTAATYTDRFPGHLGGNHLTFERVLVATSHDGRVWVPTACAVAHWNDPPEAWTNLFQELPSDLIPKAIQAYQSNTRAEWAVLRSDGTLMKAKPPTDRTSVTLNLNEDLVEISDRHNWLSFNRSYYTTVALSDDGLLWHSGPYPVRGKPNGMLPLIVPATQKLRPIFDFQTGKNW